MQPRRFYKAYLSVAVIVIFVPTATTQNEHLIPDFCELRKPKSDGNCETERRWFLHETKGCKPFGICRHQTAELDAQTGINYFTSKESCQSACAEAIQCPELPAPENGNVIHNIDGVIGWGAKVNYTCNEGYEVVGSKQRSCQKTATWDGSAPTCRKQCSPPPRVENGTFVPIHSHYNQGTRIFYTCEDGYSSQITERTCESGGVWSGPEPVCELQDERFCPEPLLIHNGDDIYAPDRSVGGTTTYSCLDGFILIGNSTRTCGPDGLWEGVAPVCWKLSLEYFIEDSSEMEQMDITNKTLSLPIATQNVWVMTGSSHPDPLKDVVPVWFFNDEVLIAMEHPHGVEQHGSKLKFTRILESREQEGNYTIRIGSYSVSFLLVVEEEVIPPPSNAMKPVLMVMPANMTTGLGGSVRFTCVFSGCPAPNVTWFHKGTALEHGGRVIYEQHQQHRLTICQLNISNVSEEDTGTYKCVGDNLAGNTSSELVGLQLMDASRTKRSMGSSSSLQSQKRTLCKQNSDPESVTVLATVRKELRRVRSSRWLRNYRFKVDKFLKGNRLQSTSNNKTSLRVVIANSNDNSETAALHLEADTQYILNGRMLDNVLYISGPQYIHHYSNELESHIQSC